MQNNAAQKNQNQSFMRMPGIHNQRLPPSQRPSILGEPPSSTPMPPAFTQRPPPSMPFRMPQWIGPRGVPPPIIPGQSLAPIPPFFQPPPVQTLAANPPPVASINSSIPVVPAVTKDTSSSVNQGIPIPTVVSHVKREDETEKMEPQSLRKYHREDKRFSPRSRYSRYISYFFSSAKYLIDGKKLFDIS